MNVFDVERSGWVGVSRARYEGSVEQDCLLFDQYRLGFLACWRPHVGRIWLSDTVGMVTGGSKGIYCAV